MKCSVAGCAGDVTGSSGHPFPSGAVMRHKWHRALIQARAAPKHDDAASASGGKVCEKHFKPEDFETAPDGEEKKSVLKTDAVPTPFASDEGRTEKTGSLGSQMSERLRFRQRTQGPEEAIENYIHGLQVGT